jgi:hypothetical protein
MLDELLGAGQIQKEYRDFVNRYEQGEPSEGYSDQEVLKRYGEVSHAVSPDQYAQAAQEALSKLSPEERAAFVKMLQDRAAARGVTLPRQVAPEPKDLGQVLTDLHVKPGQLRDILGGGDSQAQQQASGSSRWIQRIDATPFHFKLQVGTVYKGHARTWFTPKRRLSCGSAGRAANVGELRPRNRGDV